MRRLERLLRRLFRRGYVKRQQAWLVHIDGQPVKRLVLPDSHVASSMASNLRAFEDSPVVPDLLASFENEVWVEYIRGQGVRSQDPRLPGALADLYASVCSRNPRYCDTRELGLARELRKDLRFLQAVGVIEASSLDEIMAWLDATLPEKVWLGHDYSDPKAGNFLWDGDGALRILDVESLVSDRLIGCGVAKALVSWMAPQRSVFLAELERRSLPDFLSYLPFVELQFLASWQKRSVLQRKNRLVASHLFDRFRGGESR